MYRIEKCRHFINLIQSAQHFLGAKKSDFIKSSFGDVFFCSSIQSCFHIITLITNFITSLDATC